MTDKAIRYVIQDGANFEIYRDAEMTDLQDYWRANLRVRDYDIAAAQQAREACERQLRFAGYDVVWPNPFERMK